jgi:hypothetical protein
MQLPLLISAAALIIIGLSTGTLIETIVKLAVPVGL